MSEEINIPESWGEIEFEKVLDYIQPTNYIVQSTEYSDNYKIPVLTPGKSFIKGYTNEKEGVFTNLPTIIFDDFTTASKYVNFPFKVKSSAMKILVPYTNLVNLKFIFHAIQLTNVRSDTHKRYWISVFAKKKFPLPPFNEQNRIISKIEELFSDLDNGIHNLKLAQNQLKVYRQALLKHAFEGKLTEQWRKENNPEPAEKLLERIKEERQKRYKQELADWKMAVKEWEKDGKKKRKPSKPRFKPELSQVEDDDNSLEIKHNSWLKQNLNNITFLITDGKHGDCKNEENSGYYFLSAKDIKNGHLNYEKARQINFLEFQEVHNRTNLAPGDICLVNTGATVGKIAIAPNKNKTFQTTFQKSVAIIKVFNELVYVDYVAYMLIEKNRKLLSTSKGTAVNNLLLKDIKSFLIPIPSKAEQLKIVQELDSQFSIINKLEQTIESSLKKSETLRQSVLKKAFEGKLVEQDSNDEPSSKLLKRIKEEKEKYLAEQKKLKKKAPKKIKKMSKNLSIEEVLKTSDKPMLAKDVWQQSKHKDNIEDFYAELKKIQEQVKEVKKGTESLLSLAK